MYSPSLEKLLKKSGISLGDCIRTESPKGTFEGILMPRAYESDILVLKLDNGYNIGISSKNAEISRLKKAETRSKTQDNESDTSGGNVAILGCGGTIASKIEYKTGAVFPAISPEEMKAAFPGLDSIASIHTKKLFSLLSEDMNSEHWSILGKAILDEIKKDVEGVVLMHGTDTMHYSAAAAGFMLQELPVPIIFVGAQRSSDRPSSDNELNLLNAVYTARQDFAEVGLCMHANTNDDFCHVHRGVKVRKLHTSRRDAFRSVNISPLAKVNYSRNEFTALSEFRKREKRTIKTDFKFNDNVAMLYVHPNIQPKLISKFSSFDGVVLLGTGLGHVPTNPFGDKHAKPVINEIKSLVDSDIPVVMAPQTIYGRLNMNVYTAGRLLLEAGVIGDGCDWTPETAFVKLSWVLGHTKNMNKVKEEMLTNMVGEISERSFTGVD